jgi:glycosyltransferase involved in cell wall biosynthesis
VIFLGNREDVPRLMAASQVVLVPSLESAKEGFGRVAMEAMAMEKPVVASRTGGLPEVVTENTGILVPPGDAQALAEALDRLLEDGELRRELGRAGRRRVEELFDLNHTVSEVKRVYRELLAERRGRENP